jgi:hypothetical protein
MNPLFLSPQIIELLALQPDNKPDNIDLVFNDQRYAQKRKIGNKIVMLGKIYQPECCSH